MNKSVAQQQVTAFRRHMQKIGTKARAEGEKNYLKSALRFHGVPVPEIRKAAKKFAKAHPDLDRDGLLTLVTELFTDEHELRTLAIALLEQFVDRLRAEDIRFVEELLRRCEGWAHVDYLAVRIAGSLVQRFKLARRVLARWNRDESFWIRRAGMLALLLELRDGSGDFDQFAKMADRLVEEKEFFIRKAIGWVLRESSRQRPELTQA